MNDSRSIYFLYLLYVIKYRFIEKKDFGSNKTQVNICFTNMMRKKVNAEKMIDAVEANKKGKKHRVLQLKKLSYDANSQDVSIMKGTPIIARITTADFFE